MESNTNYHVWTVSKLKRCEVNKLSEMEKLNLKNSRPTPDVSIIQESSSNGLKFILLFLSKPYLNTFSY